MEKRFLEKLKLFKLYWCKATFILLILCSIFKLNAQKSSSFPNIEYITSDIGLSQNEVTAILQDSKGLIWIGTRGGLNRYDGSSIKVFQNEIGNTNTLINNSIETLFEDSKGNIWIGTKSNGVSTYNPKTNAFQQIKVANSQDHLETKRVISINESLDGNIWLGTWKSGLTIFNPTTNTSRHILETVNVSDILKSSKGNIWVATSLGAYVFTSKGEQIDYIYSLGFTSVIEDQISGNFYFGTWGRGLIEYNIITKVKTEYSKQGFKTNTPSSNSTYKIYKDKQRNLWIGTWGGGLNHFNLDTKVFTFYNLSPIQNTETSELYKDVIAVYRDRLGLLWLGTNGGGLCKVDTAPNQFGTSIANKSIKGLPNNPVWSITKDNDNVLWVGLKGKSDIYYSKDGKSFKSSYTRNNKSRTRKTGFKAIFQEQKGSIWFAGNDRLLKVDKVKDKFIQTSVIIDVKDEKDYSYKYTALHQTSDGVFWIGTQQRGLKKSISSGNPENQKFETYLQNKRISTFIEQKNGNFWVGTYNGLQLYQPKIKNFINFKKKQGETNALSSNIIICLHEDKQGDLWVGTPNGLNKLDLDENNFITFKSYQVKDGLPNNYIHSIQEDKQGNLWISTNKGISKYNIKENSFYNYDVNDGLQSNSFMEDVGLKDEKGKLYFGGIKGLNSFNPKDIKNNPLPPVILTSLKISGQEIHPKEKYNDKYILNKSIDYTQEISLTNEENIFSIDYTALDFHTSSRYTYSFKMEGLDDDWQASTSQKNVNYSNLNAGNYEFKVKTVYGKKNIDSEITSLKIKILPPFWKTWQAFLLYLIVFMGLLYLFSNIIRQRHDLESKLSLAKLNRVKEKELAEMKTRFFTNIAHEIRTPLSLITGPIESLINSNLDKDERNNYLKSVHYQSKRLLSLVSQLLDFRKIENGKMTLQVVKGNFVEFTNEIFLSFRDLAISKEIQFELDSEKDDIQLTFDSEKLEIVLCNLLSNAFKYSKSKIKIKLSIEGAKENDVNFNPKYPKGYCKISINDNGQGMSDDVINRIFDRFYQIANTESINLIGTGIGLALVKNIVELHQGDVFVKSTTGKGSTFTVKIPLGETHFEKSQLLQNFKKADDPVHYQVIPSLTKQKNTPIKNISDSGNLPNLLIIEDNPEIRSFIRSIFQKNYNIHEAENGKLGFEKAKNLIPNVIISDLMMPEMDGLELCNALKEAKETLHIPIIMLTARTASIFQEKGYSSGVDLYVTKPFNPTVLKIQVDSLLNNRKRLKNYFNNNITLLPTENDVTSFDQEFLNKLIKLVEDNISNEKMNREFLASRMSVSSSTLYRKIKSITEMNVTSFIRSIKLKRAAKMIINKEDNISGIAYQVGFNDPKYFRKCFIGQFGVAPSQYGKKEIPTIKQST